MAAALLVSTKWDIGDSGTGNLISEFQNKTLQTGELSEIHCTVLDVEVDEHQRQDAARYGVNLIPGTKDPWSEKPTVTWFLYPQVHYPQIGNLTNIQHVISYGTDTKKAASAIQARLFPKAKLYLLPSPDHPTAALFVFNAWNKDDYGLTGFHRIIVQEFCERRAKAGKAVKAYSIVLDIEVSDDQKTDAVSCGVTLIPAKQKEGIKPKDDPPTLLWLLNYESYYPDLGNLENIQYVVGYAPKTGFAANYIKTKLFPNAKLVLINHACPDNSCLQATMDGLLEFEDKMLEMASGADLIFSIGPTIYKYFKNAYRAEILGKQLSDIPHEEILPQVMANFSEKYPEEWETSTFWILTCGQLDTPEALEPCTVIASSIGTAVENQLQTTPLKWKIQGVSAEADKTDLVKNLNKVQLTLQPGFSADKLLRSLQQSHLCIPAPVYLDYGFIGLEAAVFGVPTVFNNCAELANFIKYHFEEHEDDWIAEEGLTKKILQHLKNPSKAFKKAKKLKADLLQSKEVSGSYAKFASLLTQPLQQQMKHDPKPQAGVRNATVESKSGAVTQGDQQLSKPQPTCGPEKKVTETEETTTLLQNKGKDEKEKSGPSQSDMEHDSKDTQDRLTVLIKLDDNVVEKRLTEIEKKTEDISEQLQQLQKEKNKMEAVWKVYKQTLRQKYEDALGNEHPRCQEATTVHMEDLGTDSLTVSDIQVIDDRLIQVEKETRAISEQLQEVQKEEKNVRATWTVQKQTLKRRHDKRLGDEHGCPKAKKVCKENHDSPAVPAEKDITSHLTELEKKTEAIAIQLQQVQEEKKNVKGVWTVCKQAFKRLIDDVLDDEHGLQKVEEVCKAILGDVHPYSLSTESLAIFLRFLTHYSLCRLKQTCRSRSLAKAFEPLLITDEMREIAAKVGITLELKATYDKEKFTEVELFFINRDGGGIEPLKSYDDILDEMYIDDDDSNCQVSTVDDHHEQDGNISMTADIEQSKVPSEMLLLEIDPKLEMKPSTETNVCTLLNPVKLTRQRGKQYDVLQMVIKMTDRVQHILTSRLEILALLGFVRYLLTVVAGEDGTQSFSELEEELSKHGKPILPIRASHEPLSLQVRSLLPFQISQECLKDTVIRYLAIEKSKIQSLYSQLNIKESEFLAAKESLENQLDEALKEQSKFKTAKESLENQLDETLKEKSKFKTAKESLENQLDEALKEQSKFKTAKEILENQLDETLQEKSQLEKRFKEQSEKDNKVIITQHTDYLILKDRLEKLEPNMTDLQSKLEQKDKFTNELMTKLTKLSDAQSNVALQEIITETLEHGEEFITGETQWEGETVSDILGKEETQETQKTATETSIQDHQTTTPEEQGAASTETKKVEGDWSKLTLDGQGPHPGQKFNNPCGLTFHDDKLLVCDTLNNIVQILNQDYTCVQGLGSFSGQFAKPFQPVSVAVSQDNHYFILDDNNLQIVVCDQNNKVISIITLPADVNPNCIALLKGFVLVTDVKGHRLLKYTMTGQHVAEVGSLGLGKTRFHYPLFVAVNSKDVIMVSDSDNSCIKCFDSDFNYLYQYGEEGPGDSQLYFPYSIAVDGADNVYVCDYSNARISIWSPDGTWLYNLFTDDVSYPLFIAVSRDRICVRGRDDKHITVFSK